MPAGDRPLAVLLALCATLTLGLGVTKVFVQKHHPPSWFIAAQNSYRGYVAIDRYAERSEAFRDWMLAKEGSAERLRADFQTYGHATSLLTPFLVASASLITGAIPSGFILTTCLATLLQIGLAMRIASLLAERDTTRAALVAGVLAAVHVIMVRTTGQLHSDPITAAVGCAAVLGALSWCRRPSARAGVLLFLVQVAGGLTKLSYLPFLGAPAILAFATHPGGRLRAGLSAALLFGVLPTMPALVYLLLGPGFGTTSGDVSQVLSFSSHWDQLVVELGLLLQILPLAFFLSPRAGPETRRAVWGIGALLALQVAFVASTGLPDHRLYLPVVAPLAAVAGPWFVRRFTAPRTLTAVLLIYAGANYAAALLALLLPLRS